MSPRRAQRDRVIHQAASWCLSYPDTALVELVPVLRGVPAVLVGVDVPPVTASSRWTSRGVRRFDMTEVLRGVWRR